MFKRLCADPAEIAVPTGAIVKDLDVVEDFGPRHISGLVDPCLCVLIIAAIGMSLTVYILRTRRASHLLERLLTELNGHRLIGIVGPDYAIDDHALSPAPDR